MDNQNNRELVPINNTENSLLDLDDMALNKIIKYLPLIDLSHLIETCKRMENLVSEHLRQHHSNVHWKNNTIKLWESERVFRNIGRYIKSIKLSMWTDFEFYEILVLLAHECSNLETMILESVGLFRPALLADPFIKLMFAKLKRFVLSGCYWQGWCPLSTLFGVNRTLEDLTVANCCGYNGFTYQIQISGFRSLKKFRLTRCRNVMTTDELVMCLVNNDISSLVLNDIGNVSIPMNVLVESLSETVEDLSLDFFNMINVTELSRLQKLKVIRLRCNVYADIDAVLSQLGDISTIEELVVLRICISSRTIDALRKFKNLQRLRLDHVVNSTPRQFFRSLPMILPNLQQFLYGNSTIRDEDILFMFKLMRHLTRLNLYGCNSLATKTYLHMIAIVENDWHRPKLDLIPPKWESMRSMIVVKHAKKNKMSILTDMTGS